MPWGEQTACTSRAVGRLGSGNLGVTDKIHNLGNGVQRREVDAGGDDDAGDRDGEAVSGVEEVP